MPFHPDDRPLRFRHLLDVAASDRAGGVALVVATVAALVWANVDGRGSYHRLWLAIPAWSAPLGLRLSVRDWVNQGVMVGFFALVGLEIRREFGIGTLRSWRRASVPVLAALGGMAVPAAIYLAVMAGAAGAKGWGIPMATDVAFALGVLALFERGSTPRLRVFLMTLAVADDLASLVILAVFYNHDIRLGALFAGIAALGAMVGLRALGVQAWWAQAWWVQAMLAVAGWLALVHAGMQAAIIGVLLGTLGWASTRHEPHAVRPQRSGPRHGELRLTRWVNLVVLPVFALANAGLSVAGSGLGSGDARRVLVAVLAARLIGKPLGITAVSWSMTRGSEARHLRLGAREQLTTGTLASIGFTVPLLIIRAALPDGPLAAGATAGLLLASVLGAAGGAVLLRLLRRGPRFRRAS